MTGKNSRLYDTSDKKSYDESNKDSKVRRIFKTHMLDRFGGGLCGARFGWKFTRNWKKVTCVSCITYIEELKKWKK